MEYRVCAAGEIEEGQCRLVRVGERELGLFRVHGRFYAYQNRCVHQGGPVCRGEIIGKVEQVLAPDRSVAEERISQDEIHIVCPWHGWEYDLATGVCAGERSLRLRSFPVAERDGELYVVA